MSSNGANSEHSLSAITVNINGTDHVLDGVDPHTTLLTYLRSRSGLTGTKRSCAEGGCGACTVVVKQGDKSSSVNSCLKPLVSCDGLKVVTVEGLGNKQDGYHPIQSRVAEMHGTQCGFCTPGFVMGMYSVLEKNPKPSSEEVEKYFDGNLCRCTGYRPILSAFKTFATDNCDKSGHNCSNTCTIAQLNTDIEELQIPQFPPYEHTEVITSRDKKEVHHLHDHTNDPKARWFTPKTLSEVHSLLDKYPTDNKDTALVFGHTSGGIYKDWRPTVYISLQNVSELKGYKVQNDSVTVGGCTTINEFIDALKELNSSSTLNDVQKSLLPELLYMTGRIASNPIRNAGSVAGNLMLANKYIFPSDLAISLMGLGATVTVSSSAGEKEYDIGSFVHLDMNGKLLKSFTFPLGKPGQIYHVYKTALRKVHSHSIVDAGFSATVKDGVISDVILALGNIREKQIRMSNTENALNGKTVNDSSVLKQALASLLEELKPYQDEPRIQYRTNVALSFLYKFYISLLPSTPTELKTAVERYQRPVSCGEQHIQVDPKILPVGGFIQKVRGQEQASGESVFTDDIPPAVGTLHAAFVYSSAANAEITSIDTSAALKIAGVTAWISAEDIPGEKTLPTIDTPLFADKKVEYAGQPVGLIIALDQATANLAAQEVVVHYKNEEKPILSVSDAITKGSYHKAEGFEPISSGNIEQGLKESAHILSGSLTIGSQYHFHLETQTCTSFPDEGGEMRVQIASQMPSIVHEALAGALDMSQHDISVEVKRCGGGYGGKLSNSILIACATAVAAKKLKAPVRCVMTIDTNMKMLGRRPEYYVPYTVGFDKDGKLKAVKILAYMNGGVSGEETCLTASILLNSIDNVYYSPNFFADAKICKTNTPRSTSVRGPGWVPAIYIIEYIMEHVASFLEAKPEEIKKLNFLKVGQTTPTGTKINNWSMETIWDQVIKTSDYHKRSQEIAEFNSKNKWVKRGISIIPVRFGVMWKGNHHQALVRIYKDGTVLVSTSGVEIGQGLETKVAQMAAYKLKLPLQLIRVSLTSTMMAPNSSETGGSSTSELVCSAIMKACDGLNARLAPVKAKLEKEKDGKKDSEDEDDDEDNSDEKEIDEDKGKDVSNKTKEQIEKQKKDEKKRIKEWNNLIETALKKEGVSLQEQADVYPNEPGPDSPVWQYQSYSAAVTEVRLDVLTGEQEILRTDIVFDNGVSLSPGVDLGQIEGAFTMGLGLYLTEEVSYNEKGHLYNHNSWEYKPPSAYDIPIDFRVAILKNSGNPLGIMGSKATGEPPACLSCSAVFALQHAAFDSRKERGVDNKNFGLSAPLTVDRMQTACAVDPLKDFTF